MGSEETEIRAGIDQALAQRQNGERFEVTTFRDDEREGYLFMIREDDVLVTDCQAPPILTDDSVARVPAPHGSSSWREAARQLVVSALADLDHRSRRT